MGIKQFRVSGFAGICDLRRSPLAVALIALLWGLDGGGSAQIAYQGGQWAGPYELGAALTEDGDGNPNTFWQTQEISHMLLAPPSRAVGEPRSERVLIQAVPGGGCAGCTLPPSNQKFGRLYRWSPRTPTNATLVPVPTVAAGYLQDGSQDFFCGGHTFLANGDLLWVGGTDKKSQCEDCANGYRFFGHDRAWRLDLSTWLPAWVSSGTMGFDRWYPTATLLNQGDVYAQGHTAQPALNQDAIRDVLTAPLGAFAWSSPVNNPWSLACNSATLVDLEDYPRLHLLSTGELFWSAAYEQVSVGPSATFIPNPSKFLDVKVQPTWPSCSTKRWRDGPLTSDLHINGSSLHFITWDKDLDAFSEVVYVIGGAQVSIEGNDAECATAGASILASVEKIVNPTGGGGNWTSAPSLNYPRVNHNSVILLDGSIMALGGHGSDAGTCVSRFVPERYRPLEVFEDITAPGPGWQLLAPQAIARRYHAGAVLLPDGRVCSGGGKNLPTSEPDWDKPDHTVEIYSPHHYFSPSRPEIDESTLFDPAAEAYSYASEVLFEVTISAAVDRVALIRNGATTHAFDSDQRYVELRIVENTAVPGDPTKRLLKVDMPPDGYHAPPGYYLLSVTDVNHVPSPAEWIRIQ